MVMKGMIKMIMTGELFCTFITIFDIMDDYLLHHCMIIRFIMIDYYHFHKNYDNAKPRHPRKNPRTCPTPGSPQPSDLVFHCHHHNDDDDDDDDDATIILYNCHFVKLPISSPVIQCDRPQLVYILTLSFPSSDTPNSRRIGIDL